MKKNYLKPEIESIVINSSWALCQQVSIDPNQQQPPGQGGPSGPPGAPKKVF